MALKRYFLVRQAMVGGSAVLLSARSAAMSVGISTTVVDTLLVPTRRIIVTRQSYAAQLERRNKPVASKGDGADGQLAAADDPGSRGRLAVHLQRLVADAAARRAVCCDDALISRFDELEPEHGLVTLFNKVFNDLVARPAVAWDEPFAKD